MEFHDAKTVYQWKKSFNSCSSRRKLIFSIYKELKILIVEIIQTNQKWAYKLDRQFSKEIQMARKYLKKQSIFGLQWGKRNHTPLKEVWPDADTGDENWHNSHKSNISQTRTTVSSRLTWYIRNWQNLRSAYHSNICISWELGAFHDSGLYYGHYPESHWLMNEFLKSDICTWWMFIVTKKNKLTLLEEKSVKRNVIMLSIITLPESVWRLYFCHRYISIYVYDMK